MNSLSINTYPNHNIVFQANPKIVLTKDMLKTMPVKEILELSSATLQNQDINIVRMIFAKINTFVKLLTSKCSYLKANEMNFPMKELEKTKVDKKKAKKIEKVLGSKIKDEKIKKGLEVNQGTNDAIPIEYLILPEEERIHQRVIKHKELLVDLIDANRYKYQRAKHDRVLAKRAFSQLGSVQNKEREAEKAFSLSAYAIGCDYVSKKKYNDFAEKILFAETKEELSKLQEKIGDTELIDWLKSDLFELIKRKRNLL